MRAGKKTIFCMHIGISKIFLQAMEKVEALLLFQIPLKMSLVDFENWSINWTFMLDHKLDLYATI